MGTALKAVGSWNVINTEFYPQDAQCNTDSYSANTWEHFRPQVPEDPNNRGLSKKTLVTLCDKSGDHISVLANG